MDGIRDDFRWEPKITKPLKVIVVGAGMAGLTAAIGLHQAGHHVTVLEKTKEISEIGAGINIPPNASRILHRFGILPEVMKHANCLDKCSLRRYHDNEEVGSIPLMPKAGERYGAPLAVIHRGDLQRCLLEAIRGTDISVRTNSRVTAIDAAFEARVQINDDEWLNGDVVLAADGVKSELRSKLLSAVDFDCQSIPTGDAAYRIQIPRSQLLDDPEALAVLEGNMAIRWMGPSGHIMAYPICNNKILNMVLLHPDRAALGKEESWTRAGDKAEMLAAYAGYNPLVQKLISYVPEGDVLEWTLNSHGHLPTWVRNKVALVGDACHPMLPYVAQGAANAMEDAAVLAVALSMTDNVNTALDVYELVRKSRGEAIQDSAVRTRNALHLPDGKAQEARDDAMAESAATGKCPDLWSDADWQQFMWGVDVMKVTVDRWELLRARAESQVATPLAERVFEHGFFEEGPVVSDLLER